jgi:hypothetical protein
LLNPKPHIFGGDEREIVARSKRAKHRKKPDETMLPNLSGVSFKDALKALLKTPLPPDQKKGKK